MAHSQAPISICRTIRNAVLFGNQQDTSRVMNADSLVESVGRLLNLLRERSVDYVLVGGLAMLQYVASRNTEDIDLLMAATALKRLPELDLISQDANFVRARFGDLQVDVLLTDNRLFKSVRRGFVTTRAFAEQEVQCATVEGLILLKLYALPSLYRMGDFARVSLYENDIAMLFHEYEPDTDALLSVLDPHLSASDRTAIREIVAEIQQRIARFKERRATSEK
jgi:hypothetical protein